MQIEPSHHENADVRAESPLGHETAATSEQIDPRKQRLRRVAWLLDDSIPIPFTSRKIGIDAIVGLIPGLGDAAGGLMSTWILMQGVRFNVPLLTLIRMALNVALEVVVGFIPFLGDLFDMVWKANYRNVALLERYIDRPVATARRSVAWVMIALLCFVSIGVLSVWIGVRILALFWNWISLLWAG